MLRKKRAALVGRELAAQIHLRLPWILHLVQAGSGRMPHVHVGASDRPALPIPYVSGEMKRRPRRRRTQQRPAIPGSW